MNQPRPTMEPGVDQPDQKNVGWCPHCRQHIKPLNPHRMDRRKVEVLQEIARINARGHKWVKIQQDGSLIPLGDLEFTIQTDAVHPLRLKWFGLVQTKAPRTALYRVTRLGFQFLAGRLSVPSVILCRNGFVILQRRERVWINQIKNVVLNREYWSGYWREQFEQVSEQLF
ncbi:MAG: hypothetical protein ACE1Y4_03405 [Lysobacterales bacterium]